MASGSTVPRDPQTVSQSTHRGISSGFIESQLEKTSSEVRLVEISIAILTLCLTVLGYLLVLGILEHWFLSDGLSALTRTLLLIGLITALILYARRRLLPYVRYKISLAYAAHTIEQSEPRLKNSLLNFLFLRRKKKGVPDVVLRGLEQQAATGLSRVSLDLSIERKRLTHLGLAVIGIILFGAVYTIFSPKSLAPEVGRMLFPWADIDAATRVTIRDVEPGNKNVALRSNVQISATVKGLRKDEPVTLVFSSAGGGAVDRRLPMQAGSDTDRYDCQITEANIGMVSDLTYHIEAGDTVSKAYQLQVMPAPSFQIKKVDYKYPPYTGLESRTVKDAGDVRAIEGTRVTIHAESTDEIAVATLNLQPEIDAEQEVPRRMDVSGNRAAGQLMLRRKPIAGDSIPEYAAYYLSLKTASGETNPNQVRHQISVLRDEAPLVDILLPQEATLEVREDDALTFEVRGRDPDFRLTELWLVGHQGDRERIKIDLLGRSKRAGEPLRAVHRESTQFAPRDWDLKAGETVSMFAVAIDNKQPAANRTETASVQVQILPPLEGNRSSKSNSAEGQEQGSSPGTEREGPAQGQSEESGSEQGDGDSGQQAGSDSTGDGNDAIGNASGQEQTGKSEPNNGSGNNSGQPDGSAGENSGDGSSDAQDGQEESGQGESGQGESGQGESEQGERGQGERGQQENSGGADSGGESDSDTGEREANRETNGSSASARAGAPDDRQGTSQDNDSGSSQANQNARQAPGTDSKAPPADQPPSAGSQAGEASGAGETENSKVDNDGDAFEQLNEIIQQKSSGGSRSSANSSADSESTQTSEDSEQNQTTSQESPSEEANEPTSSSVAEESSSQAQPDQDSGTNATGQTADSDPERPRDGTGQRDRISDSNENKSEQAEQASDAGAEASRDETGGGTGNPGDQPPPPGEGSGRDRRKSGTPQQDSQQEKEPSDGGVSERDSDSAEGQEGSRHGKGQEGGGQQSQQQGEGSAGSNTPSDAGKGASGEPGQGESGSGQGNNPQSGQSEQQTGKPGTGAGEGSSQQSADSAAENTREGTGGAASNTPSTKPDQGTPPGEGGGGVGSAEPENFNGLTEPGADSANLDYANQTTDLVLDYLEQQLDAGGIDEDLKKQFGWTDQDFSDFVRRYRTMKNKAQVPGADGSKAKNNWENVLRSLGLTPPQRGDRTSATPANRTSGLRESGRSRPPREDQNRFDAFRRDVLGR